MNTWKKVIKYFEIKIAKGILTKLKNKHNNLVYIQDLYFPKYIQLNKFQYDSISYWNADSYNIIIKRWNLI